MNKYMLENEKVNEPYYTKIWARFLVSDLDYQRVVDTNRVKEIVRNFNPNLVNPLKVSRRDGRYYVFDGQHTLGALKLINNSDDFKVNCLVYEGLTKEEEAKLFAEQTGISRKLTSGAKFKALYTSGDKDIINWRKATEGTGIKMNFIGHQGKNKIIAYSKAYKIWKNVSHEDYVDILQIILQAWGGEAESLGTKILGGVYEFYKQYRGSFKREILISQLSKVSPSYIIREGDLSHIEGDKKYARQIVFAYNKKLRSNKLINNL